MPTIETDLFDDFPTLRRELGKYGNTVNHVRPTQTTFRKWLDRRNGQTRPRVWTIIDYDENKRVLIRSDVVTDTIRDDGRTVVIRVDLGDFGKTGIGRGLVMHIPFLGIVICPYTEGDCCITPDAYQVDTTYTLNDLDTIVPYIPNEDVDLN